MSSPKQSGKSPVIQGYLNGKSMDQIASETNVSKGKVHYLINDWKNEIGVPDIDDAEGVFGHSQEIRDIDWTMRPGL